MTKMKFLLPVLAVILLSTGWMGAQSTTQGAVGGTAQDTSGAAVPQATVVIHNDGTNAEVHLVTDASGYFKAPLLEPGTYTVTVKALGFREYRASNVTIQVGQLTSIEPRLSIGNTSEVVNVTSEAPVINTESPDFASNLNQRALDNIPMNNRRWSSLAVLTPGVVNSSTGFGLVSVRGISNILNTVLIDGADDNQAYFSEERGRTREAYSTSASAVREFQVNTGVYAAEFGRAAGGVINSVTKSGTNNFHGVAYFSDRQSKWAAFNKQTTLTTLNPTTNTYVTNPFKAKDLRKIYGFTVDGPIITNKVFFTYTFDQHAHIFPLIGVPTNPSAFYALPDAGTAGSNNLTTSTGATYTCNLATGYLAPSGVTTAAAPALDAQTCTLAARLQAGSYAAGATAYVNGINALNSDLGPIPRTGYQEINTPKLDWKIGSKNQASFVYHRLRWDSPGGVQTVGAGAYSQDSAGNDFVKLDYIVAKLTSQIRGDLTNEVLYQYGHELNDETLQKLSAYSVNNLQTADGNVPYISLLSGTGFNVGAPYYSFRPKFPDERKWQIGDTLYWVHGKHSVKAGIDTVHNYDLTNASQYYEGLFGYTTSIGNYLADLGNKGKATGSCNSTQSATATATVSAVGLYPCYNTLRQDFGPPTFDFATTDYGFFVQDNWKITPRLSLELGLRYDYEALPSVVSSLTTASGNYAPFNGINSNPSDKNNFGPRIGFAYDMLGSGRMVLRGGYGIFYGRLTNGNQGTVLQTTGSPLAQSTTTVSASTGLASEPVFPNRIPASQLGTGTAAPSAYFRSPTLQNPQLHEFDLQYQLNLGRGTVFQASYLGALGRELPNFLNLNLDPATKANVNITVSDSTGAGPIPSGTVLTIPTFTKYGNTALFGPSAVNYQAITELISNINSSYHAFAVEIQNRSLKNIQFDVNYTWSHALDFSQNDSTAGNLDNWYDPYSNPRANYGNSLYDTPNRLVAYLIYTAPDMKAGPEWLHYLTNGWNLDNDFQAQNGLPFTATSSGKNSSGAVGNFWNGNNSVSYLPQVGHSNYFLNKDVVDDVRIGKTITFAERYKAEFYAQVFNVGNTQNETATNPIMYKLAAVTATTGTATYQTNFGQINTTNNSGFTYAPRQIEISARFNF